VEAWVFLFCVRLANMWSVPEVFLKFWFSWIDEYLKNGRPSGTADLVQWHQQNQIRIKISFRNYFHQIFCVCAIGWAVMALFTIFGNLEGSKLGRIIFKRIIFKIFWSEHVWLIWLDRTDGSLSQLPSSMYPTRDINPHLTHFFVNLFAWILQYLLFCEKDENCSGCAVDSSESTNIVFLNTIISRINWFVNLIGLRWCVRLDLNWFSCDVYFLNCLHVLRIVQVMWQCLLCVWLLNCVV